MKTFCDIKLSVAARDLPDGCDPEDYAIEVTYEDQAGGSVILFARDATIAIPVKCVEALIFAVNHVADFPHHRDCYLLADEITLDDTQN